MDAAEILTQNVDKTQLPPLHQKRVLAFVNHFLISSCGFLNDFALQCEKKFIELERKLQKVEAALVIIEAKLASIPDIEKQSTQTEISKQEECNKPGVDEVEPSIKPTDDTIKGTKAAEHGLYKKFFKMLQVGVPNQAIKIKMQVEGLDPNMLDDSKVYFQIGNFHTNKKTKASIPDIEKQSTQTEISKQEECNKPGVDEVKPSIKPTDDTIKGTKAAEHGLYKKFFKMLQVGVPNQAIKIKMQVDGLDPNMLDNPNLIIPSEDIQNS